jgi:predicted DNA-binding antitoxin AbrB/MazE fold protein
VAEYEFKDGRVNLRNPVKVKVDKIEADITGSTGFDQTIDYKWKMKIPSEVFGSQANSALNDLLKKANSAAGTNLSAPSVINVNALFGGTVMKPTIKTDMKDGAKETVNTVKEEVVTVVKDKANEEAQKILTDAQAQVERIKAETQTKVDQLKAEGYAQADQLVAQAGNPIAKIAAKKGAEIAKKGGG